MLFDTIKIENMKALKNKDQATRSALEQVVNKAMLVKIEKRAKGEELTDTDVILVINKIIKEIEEEANLFAKANRMEKVDALNLQKAALQKYLPKMMTEEEIRKEIDSLTDKSMPNVMKHFKTNFNGLCDMKLVNKIASGK